MKRRIFTTSDGSHSIMVDELRESFHSENGSIQESEHTFIKEGLRYLNDTFKPKAINVFEVGFGTGLNAALTQLWQTNNSVPIKYFGIEAFPLEEEIWSALNYHEQIPSLNKSNFDTLHTVEWNKPTNISSGFELTKIKDEFEGYEHLNSYNLVYFDAFAPSVQPQLWSDKVFAKLFDTMQQKSVLVTYSAAGAPRRAMTKAGFWIEEIRGAAGKREMTRAIKW